MIARIVGVSALALGLSAGAAQAATVATPTPPNIFIDLTVSFSPTPPDIIPSGSTLTGDALFFNVVGTDRTFIVRQGDFDIGALTPGQSFSVYFLPPGPCFGGNAACTFDFSFSGLTGIFPTQAFATPSPPEIVPSPPEVMPIDLSSLLAPTPPNIRLSGPIVAYDDPVVVGEWDITAGVVPEPATWAMLLLGLFGLGGVLRASRRKQLGVAAVV